MHIFTESRASYQVNIQINEWSYLLNIYFINFLKDEKNRNKNVLTEEQIYLTLMVKNAIKSKKIK